MSRGQVDALAAQHLKVWGRPPTPQELDGLIETFVRDEILYREGLTMGLDRDDPVIKRRVRQKLEVLAEEELARDPPSEAELAAFLAEHPDRFTQPGAAAFEQVFLDADTPTAEVERALALLRRGADRTTVGRATMLPARVAMQPLDLVARDFGDDFAGQLARLPVGEWSGPVASSFGLHLVKLQARTEPVLPPLEAVRDAVSREWEHARREKSLAESYRRLRDEYDVTIEPASAAAAGS